MSVPEYVLGSDESEIARLEAQAASIAEPTVLLLERGGIRPGMRVLDLGTGPGDVAFHVAEIVGPEGFVLGIDEDLAQLEVAERRAAERELRHVAFRQGDARTFAHAEEFDAVVCRLLLFHLPDAVDVVAHHARALGAGGVFIAVDYDLGGMRSQPEVELVRRAGEWLIAGFRHARADPHVGMRLPVLLAEAGLEEVQSLGLQVLWPPDHPGAPALLAGVVRSLAPAIVACGAATDDELGLDTLEQRIAEAIRAAGAVWTGPTVVGGWGRAPTPV